MKKVLCVVLSAILFFSLMAGFGGITQALAAEAPTTFGLKPFAERQTLRIGFFTGSPLSYPFLFAEKLGYFEELNIEVEFISFTNGPAMVEAYREWDIGSMGVGGLCIAMKKSVEFGLKIIDFNDYEVNLANFVRPGSPLALDPSKPENWKGTEWVYPTGTTAQAVLVKALNQVGLTLSDVKSVNSDNASSLTVFKGGTGDGLGCWNVIAFQAEDEGFVRISDAGTLDFKAPCGTVANEGILRDNLELVEDASILFHRTVEWCYQSEENLQQAADWFLEDCENEGMLTTPETARRIMDYYRGPTLSEWFDIFTKTSPDDAGLYTARELIQAEKDLFVGLDFFISVGKYTPEDRVSYLDNHAITDIVANGAKERLDAAGISY